MAVPYPIFASPRQSFFPVGGTPACCLTEDLPFGVGANCLLLGCGDPRNILFTIFSNENNGFGRVLDITCCDIEPAIIGLHNNKYLWSLFYDFFVDAETFNLLQQQSRKLVEISRSLHSWAESKYGDIIRMANSETVAVLHRLWTQYSDAKNASKEFFDHVQFQMQKTYHEHHEKLFSHDLARSSGAACSALRIIDPDSEIRNHARQFWTKGFLSPQPASNRCFSNPLFVYSSVSDRQFAVHQNTDPRNGFHLVTSLVRLTSDSPYYQERRDGRGILDMASDSAASQFRAWCDSFRRLAQKSLNEHSKSSMLHMQFCVGDAIQLCIVLNNLRQGFTCESDRYSRPWSAQPMTLDGQCYNPNRVPQAAPTTFNIIDVSYLSDHVGFLNILPVAIPLLEQSPTAALYSSAAPRKVQEQSSLLKDLFGANVSSMCTLFGIVPTAYISGFTTRAYCQDNPYDATNLPVTNRMVWRIATATDEKLDRAAATPYCNANDLAIFLYVVYVSMFPFENRKHVIPKEGMPPPAQKGPYYTRASFAMLLAFLKPRVISDWGTMMHHLLDFISSDKRARDFDHNSLDLIFHLHLTGAYSKFPFTRDIDYLRDCTTTGFPPLWPYRQNRGLFSQQNPPTITGAVVTLPRKMIQAILDKIAEDLSVPPPLNFILHIRQTDGVDHHFSSLQPVFGRLTVSANGQSCTIEEDPTGWSGTSDLHICSYVPTMALLTATPDAINLAITINPEGIITVLKDILGTNLDVFHGNAFESDQIALVESLPGLPRPSPVSIGCNPESRVMTTQLLRSTHARLDPEKQTFTTGMTLRLDKDCQALQDGGTVDYNHFSPCTVTILIGSIIHDFSFPFPIAADDTRLHIARNAGWVELIAPLVNPTTSSLLPKLACFSFRPFPIVKYSSNMLLSWNLPCVNFQQLPKIDTDGEAAKWIRLHLRQQLSARESFLFGMGIDVDPIMRVKFAILQMFAPIPNPVFRLGTSQLYLFVADFFLDLSSRSVVAEAYVLQPTPKLKVFPTVDSAGHIEADNMVTSFWAWALPAMAERCRDWNHTASCEYYKSNTPGSRDSMAAPLCSCGMGKVGEGFLRREAWRPFAKAVTRVAISPLFVAPWVEPTRDLPYEITTLTEKITGLGPDSVTVSDQGEKSKCRMCPMEGTKKCGKCKKVSYCSQDCQRKDWKQHKKSCGSHSSR